MISVTQIQDILSLYQKHGWTLRRVLLSDRLKKHLADSLQIFSQTEIIDSPIDAVWFSRNSGKNRQAWELRHLSQTPYALCEVFATDTEEEICEQIRLKMEAALQKAKG